MKKYLRLIAIFIAAAVFIFSAYQFYKSYLVYYFNERLYDSIVDKYVEFTNGEIPLQIDFEGLEDKNSDIVGWIYCEDTPINYPVVQYVDNEYYLYRMFDGSKNKTGTVYMDYRNSTEPFDLNTILYGHSIHSKMMFTCVQDYDTQDYYDAHPVMWYFTKEKAYRLDVIMSFTVDKWTADSYTMFAKPSELQSYLADRIEDSYFTSSVDISSVEKIMTFSTCSFDVENGRDILVLSITEAE